MEQTEALPRTEVTRVTESAPNACAAPGILVVDDSLTVQMALRETFESAGFRVTLSETLAEARAAIAQQAFALVVLDVLLPDGDGLELLRQIKSAPPPAIPVMLLSTEAEVRDRVRGLKTGADDYIGKPYEPSYVLARARQLTKTVGNDSPAPGVLIIDDSATFREQFKSVLEAAGYRVTTAASGEEGLSMAFAVRPDVIIIDLVLNGGIDGDAVIRRLKQDVTLRDTACLLLTASDSPEVELQALETGADAFLSKATDEKVVLARIAALLRSGRVPRLIDSSICSLLGAKRILAVDDSITFLHEVSAELREEGYSIIQATSGREALALLEVQAVDCILLDVRMPELSGYEVCRLIKQRPALRNTPLLMLTAIEEPEAVIEGINSGADDYIGKSGDFTVLKARVRAQLRRKQFEDEYRRIREELLEKELESAKARAAREIAEARAAMVDELERINRELEAFAYSASHDLRAPLRTVRGFTKAILDDFGAQLPVQVSEHLGRVQGAASRMGHLIDALLEMSRTARAALNREPVDLTRLARSLAGELAESQPGRTVDCVVEPGLAANADPTLVRVVLNNLLSNAWKFTGKNAHARIEIGTRREHGRLIYFVRDNGVGFDMEHTKRLFQPFERLHAAADFPGAGIGLATVRRIIERHRGEIWAESAAGQGATFFFTLEPAPWKLDNSPEAVATANRSGVPAIKE